MAEQPSPPPEAQQEEPSYVPFFDVSTDEQGMVMVSAGWLEGGEPSDIVLQYSGTVAQGESAIMTGFSWYVATLQEIAGGE